MPHSNETDFEPLSEKLFDQTELRENHYYAEHCVSHRRSRVKFFCRRNEADIVLFKQVHYAREVCRRAAYAIKAAHGKFAYFPALDGGNHLRERRTGKACLASAAFQKTLNFFIDFLYTSVCYDRLRGERLKRVRPGLARLCPVF
jgi:hypothetical protein